MLNFSNYALGAISDPYVNSLSNHPFINDRGYFNAGILYINAEKWKSDFRHQFVTQTLALQNDLIFGDQDVLNNFFKENWLELSYHYNTQLSHIIQLEYSKEPVNSAIFHFTGENKPLENINFLLNKTTQVVSLFRLYHSLHWDDVVTLPIGTIKLIL